MSLTREQWVEMWEIVKSMEVSCVEIYGKTRSKPVKKSSVYIYKQCQKIKFRIQSVIGQME